MVVEIAALFPVHDQEEADKHSSEMCEVSHTRGIAAYAADKFDDNIADDHPFCLYWHRDKHQINRLIWEKNAESEKHTVDGARSTDHRRVDKFVEFCRRRIGEIHIMFESLKTAGYYILIVGRRKHTAVFGNHQAEYAFLNQGRADAAAYIIDKKALRTERVLYDGAEHHKGKHVQKHVGEATVDKHICKQLDNVEARRREVMECQERIDADLRRWYNSHEKPNQHIYYHQILCHR